MCKILATAAVDDVERLTDTAQIPFKNSYEVYFTYQELDEQGLEVNALAKDVICISSNETLDYLSFVDYLHKQFPTRNKIKIVCVLKS